MYNKTITLHFTKEEMEMFLKSKGYSTGLKIDKGNWDRWGKEWEESFVPAVHKGDKLIELKDAFETEFKRKILGI